MANTNLYRKSVVERMSSPEQLDQAMKIIKPHDWIAAGFVGLLLVTAVFWGVTGKIPSKVKGQGVFINSGSLITIKSATSGIVRNVYIKNGEYVQKGQIIARVEREDLYGQIEMLTVKLENLRKRYDDIAGIKTTSGSSISKTEQMKKLYEQGLITEREYSDSRQQLMNLEHQINEAKWQLDIQISDYQRASCIFSSTTGYVQEVDVTSGSYVGAGSPIALLSSLAEEGSSLEAKLYFSAQDGKKILPGMLISISPAIVKTEEYGFIRGIVTKVTSQPVTDDYLMAKLQNKTLVSSFSKIENAMEITAVPLPNPNTYSGLLWSTSAGPKLQITPGNLCSASVILENKHPVELVVPFIKKRIMGIGE